MTEKVDENIKESKGSRRGRWLVVLPAAILCAVAAWFWISRESEPPAQANVPNQVRSTLHLETFVLNLADTDQRSYLRVGIDLGLGIEPRRVEQSAPVAQVRDTIVAVLAGAKVDDLMTAAGKRELKQRLLEALQERVPQLEVEEVYFTEFLIQR